jgi:mannan endo-1,4-beta-mannosidase
MPGFKRVLSVFSLLAVFLTACGGPKTISSVTNLPADPRASADSRAVLTYLAALTLDAQPGVVVGQNAGHGNQIENADGLVGYAPLIGTLTTQTGQTPGMLGLDYEHDLIFTPEQLSSANKVLIAHWQQGGLVTINWSPHNPWLNDESDLTGHPGIWTDTRNTGDNLKGVDMRLLVDKQSPMYVVWHRKLDRVAAALQELQAAGVVVLWRPMQEMNGSWFWWGISSSLNDPDPYVALWREMFQYFTETKGLHNLLWVYSPSTTYFDLTQTVVKSSEWPYPGDAYVDIVAGTAYNDGLEIGDYSTYLKFGKVLGMGEFGSTLGAQPARDGTFDQRLRLTRIQKDYPAMAYWVAWHNWDNGNGTQEHQAIVSNQEASAMMNDPFAITLSRLKWKDFRP